MTIKQDTFLKIYPTQKQIEFANAISSKLNIPLPKDFSFEAYSIFISDNKEDFDIQQFSEWCERRKIYYNHKYCDAKLKIDDLTLNFLYKKSGIYTFTDKKGTPLYIGKSINLAERIHSSFVERATGKYSKLIRKVKYYPMNNVADMNILEVVLISEYKPILNSESNNTEDIPQMFKSGISIKRDFITLVED